MDTDITGALMAAERRVDIGTTGALKGAESRAKLNSQIYVKKEKNGGVLIEQRC
jgi:hypothetical protein